MDLYGQLEELQGMTRVLIDDVTRLKPLGGGGNPDPTEEEKPTGAPTSGQCSR